MVTIVTLQNKSGSGVVTLPKDELLVSGLHDGERPSEDASLQVEMEEPGVWKVEVIDESRLIDAASELSVNGGSAADTGADEPGFPDYGSGEYTVGSSD